MNTFSKSLLASLALAAVTAANAQITNIDGQSLRRVESAISAPTTYGQTTDNQGRTGVIGNPSPRQAITTVAFDLNATPERRTAFENATEFTFTFNLTNILSGTANLPDLNVEYAGTFANAFSSTTVWSNASVATWASVAQYNTAAQTFTLSTTNLSSGSIDFTTGSAQYAIFRLALADRNYIGDGVNRSYGFSNTAADYDFIAVVPEPATWALLAGGLAAVIAFRRRRRD